MPHSVSHSATLRCPRCGRDLEAEIWLIVDGAERPDLLEKIRQGTLHEIACPQCGPVAQADAPLLLYLPSPSGPLPSPQGRGEGEGGWGEAHFIFSPAQKATAEEDREQAAVLLEMLRERLGDAWREEWREQMQVVPRELLPLALAEDPEAARQLPERLRREEPETYHQLQEAARQMIAALPLLAPLQAFLQAPTWNESRRVLEAHPELLSDAADRLLGQLLEAAHAQRDEDAARLLEARRALLRRCREVGIDAAFDALVGGGVQGLPPELAPLLSELARPPRSLLDMPRRAELCERALRLVEREQFPELWAALLVALANSLVQSPGGDRAENLERAIGLYEQALEVRTREAMPVEWAKTVNNLAAAYSDRLRGGRAENLEQAIALYQQALEVLTREAMPVEWAKTLHNLAAAYSDRIRGERAENLERAIGLYEQALTVLTREAMPVEWATTTMNLANAYFYRILGDRAENLERAIGLYEQALEVRTREAMPVEWAKTVNNLAAAYSDRLRGGRAENLEQAIALYQQALEVLTREAMPVEWAKTLHNLAAAYSDRILGERAENLERAIALYEQALEVRTREAMPMEWATTTMNLANAYADRLRGERAENLERAIGLYEQALTVRTREAMPVEWATTTMNLANAYSDRIRGDRAENLERAIGLYEQALQVRTREAMPVEWAQTVNNLAVAYSDRIRGDRAENMERAIALYQRALEVRTREAMPVEWATTTMNLANAYADRIRGERAENLERAIALYRQALEVRTREAMPVDWAQTANNLANAYSDRLRGDRAEDLERAIGLYEQALEVLTREAMPVDWATTTMNLANAYSDRIRGERAENLERAIGLYEQALTVMTREAMPVDWATTTMNLANAYSDRLRGERAENLERAIGLYEQALEVRTREAMPVEWARTVHNLAAAYFYRIRGERAENLERAIGLYEQALEVRTREAMPVEWATATMNLANAYFDRIRGERAENLERAIGLYEQALEVFRLETFPDAHRRVQRSLAHIHLQRQAWEKASAAARAALQATEMLYRAAPTPEARQAQLAEAQALPSLLAYARVRQAADSSALEEAVLALERYRARWLAEALALGAEKPPAVPEEVWSDFTDARDVIRQLEAEARLPEGTPGKRDFLTLSEALRTARQRLDEAIARIREDAPDVMPEPAFAQVQQAAAAAPLVYLAATSAGGLALIVHADGAQAVELPDLTGAALREKLQGPADDPALGGYLGAYFSWRRTLTAPQATPAEKETVTQAWQAALDETTAWLWPTVMAPVVAVLQDLGASEAVLIPGGLLSLLPLHAAWREDPSAPTGRRYALDDLLLTYAPSARALQAACEQAARVPADRLFVVNNPDGSLRFSDEEVATVLAHFAPSDRRSLNGEAATREAIRRELPRYTVLHFSTHGWADLRNPLQSGLLTAGEEESLTLKDILDLHLEGARLAVLSACETALPGAQLADEAISLPSGLLQAGVAGVVGSLWAVNEVSTALLIARFYDLWRGEGQPPAQALRQAQTWLRDTTNAEKKAWFRAALPDLQATRLAEMTARAGFWDAAIRHPAARDFAHPFHWAAFGWTGA